LSRTLIECYLHPTAHQFTNCGSKLTFQFANSSQRFGMVVFHTGQLRSKLSDHADQFTDMLFVDVDVSRWMSINDH